MLEFIVLGQIPGTNLVITFSWVITIVTFAAGITIAKHEYKQRLTGHKRAAEEIAL